MSSSIPLTQFLLSLFLLSQQHTNLIFKLCGYPSTTRPRAPKWATSPSASAVLAHPCTSSPLNSSQPSRLTRGTDTCTARYVGVRGEREEMGAAERKEKQKRGSEENRGRADNDCMRLTSCSRDTSTSLEDKEPLQELTASSPSRRPPTPPPACSSVT